MAVHIVAALEFIFFFAVLTRWQAKQPQKVKNHSIWQRFCTELLWLLVKSKECSKIFLPWCRWKGQRPVLVAPGGCSWHKPVKFIRDETQASEKLPKCKNFNNFCCSLEQWRWGELRTGFGTQTHNFLGLGQTRDTLWKSSSCLRKKLFKQSWWVERSRIIHRH